MARWHGQAEPLDTDVAVIGYGPVGRLAALLGRRGKHVVAVERQPRA
jgi:2-polyprenyl-6-methoxyphenol hydroxylase-like FAD-dependent oxidoreductase